MTPISTIETYLTGCLVMRTAGVPETSGYPALSTLLNEVGKSLSPKIEYVTHPKGQGAGIPDGGLFTAEQIRNLGDGALPLQGQLPARAVLEVKAPTEDVNALANTQQVRKYLEKYGLVLVTNYRDFLLLRLEGNKVKKLETYTLATDAPAFWALTTHPRQFAQAHGEAFCDYLKRVMRYAAPLTAPKDVAWFLASYARAARAQIDKADLPALADLRQALEQTLGLTFEGTDGDHFFRSTLVQTLFYGVFSAWVLWHGEQRDRDDYFDWRTAAFYLRVPIIQALFEQLADPSKLRPLGLMETLNYAGAALNRVVLKDFFAAFEQHHAVQYFYEPFLEAFDPELRKDLGVWYTPPEIVQYMVARVDTVLRTELDLPDGLADPRVIVLDPCAGTGAYLVEVLRHITQTLKDKGEGALVGHLVKQIARERVFGFELLPAPYVVAHLQIDLLLQSLGATFDTNERAGIYLTNSLTGWEPPKEPKTQLPLFAELSAERDAAEKIKREAKILVVLGNPPYNGFAGVISKGEERDLTTAYRTTKAAPAPQGQGLNDLYIRFFRMAERRITEQTGQGVVCFIANYSWLDGLSFTGMRERYLEVFDQIWVDCLNGDKYKTGKLTPTGDPDPSVFSTEFNREGIQVGTAIGLLVRQNQHAPANTVHFRHWWGKTKRADLINALDPASAPNPYTRLDPPLALGLPFFPSKTPVAYFAWPLLPDLFPATSPGVKTSRDLELIEIDRDKLLARMKAYFDPALSDTDVQRIAPALMTSTARFPAPATRKTLVEKEFESGHIVRYAYRPFDHRHAYWHPETKLVDEKREDLFQWYHAGIWFMTSRAKAERQTEGSPFYITRGLPDFHLTRPGSICFPIMRVNASGQFALAAGPNLSPFALDYLTNILGHAPTPAEYPLLWYHAIAIGYSPTYLHENADGLRQDWPRIPLPTTLAKLQHSADLGQQVAALLDTETAVAGVTTGSIRPEMRQIAVVEGDGNKLAITAGWGNAGKGGITMPGKGKYVERPPTPAEAVSGLGDTTHDVYLNPDTYWRNIPTRVWDYTIGGYQVIKKWLSYREAKLLGRPLTLDEVQEVRSIARRLAALVLLEDQLDANYEAAKW
jgi:hypothetical protein